jgi:Activator of Hsp90 ATPase homolog 1-like protein
MTTEQTTYTEPDPELRRRELPSGEARVAVFSRTYDTSVEDLWDACTNPERLARWYTTVTGELRLGGMFDQVNMGGGVVAVCDAPSHLKVILGPGGVDEIDVRVSPGPADGTATLEIQHATTLDAHEIEGQMYDAIFCMGGGYYPRLQALGLLLRGELPADYDSTAFHLNAAMRPAIDRGSAAMQALLDADAAS